MQKKIIVNIGILLVLVLVSACSEEVIRANVVKEISTESRAPQEIRHEPAKPYVPKKIIKNFADLGLGEEVMFTGKNLHILSYSNNVLEMQLDSQRFMLKQGEKISINSTNITFKEVKSYSKDSAGLVKFIFGFENSFRKLNLYEKEGKTFSEKRTYDISVDFVGKKDGESVAVFIVNNQRSSPLKEKDDFYFKEGCYILVQDILHDSRMRSVQTDFFEITAETIQ